MENFYLILGTMFITSTGAWIYFHFLLKKQTSRPLAPQKNPDEVLPVLPNFKSFVDPDIYVSTVDFIPFQNSKKRSEAPVALESFLKLIPGVLDLARKKGTYSVKFSSKVMRGLNDGSYSLMKSGGTLRAVAVDKNGKIVAQGMITGDAFASTIAGVSLAWEILAWITAQKYLSDISTRLVNIQGAIQSMRGWIKDHQDGVFEGNFRYLNELLRNLSILKTAPQVNHIKGELEKIYRESLQSIEGNRKVAQRAFQELCSAPFQGNTDENTTLFQRHSNEYYDAVGNIIKHNYLCIITEYISTVVEGRTKLNDFRLNEIKSNSEALIERVSNATATMSKQVDKFEYSRWTDGKLYSNQRKEVLKENMQRFLTICSESNKEVLSIAAATSGFKSEYSKETEMVELLVETDEEGIIVSYTENKKAAA